MARGQTEAATKTRRKNGSANKSQRSTRRRKSFSARARSTMTNAVADDVTAMRAEVNDLIASLEEKIERLNQITKQGVSHAAEGANDVMLNAIAGLTGQFTGRVQNTAKSASDDVARFGNQALSRIVAEIDRRPFLTLAIAVGIGFVAGLVRRQE